MQRIVWEDAFSLELFELSGWWEFGICFALDTFYIAEELSDGRKYFYGVFEDFLQTLQRYLEDIFKRLELSLKLFLAPTNLISPNLFLTIIMHQLLLKNQKNSFSSFLKKLNKKLFRYIPKINQIARNNCLAGSAGFDLQHLVA